MILLTKKGICRGMLVWVALGSLIFSGCVPGTPEAAIDPDAPAFFDPLPSPTPTFSAPDPDDKDPIADCALDAPICQVGFGLQDLSGDTYLAADLLLRPGVVKPGQARFFGLDIKLDLTQGGELVHQVDVQGRAIALDSGEGGWQLTDSDGTPVLSIDTNGIGLLLADPRSSPSLATAYDPSTAELLLLDAEGNPIATISAGGIGVLLADPRPSPVFLIPTDPMTDGYQIQDAKGNTVAHIDPKDTGVTIRDAQGITVGAVDPKDGGVRITDADGNTVAAIDPKDDPVAGVDPKDGGLVIRDAGGNLFASVDPKIDPVASIDPKVDPVAAVDPKDNGLQIGLFNVQGEIGVTFGVIDGLVVIASPGVGPIASIDLKGDPVAHVDPKDSGLKITMLIALGGTFSESYDISGTISVVGENSSGGRVEYGTSVIALKDVPIEGRQSPESKGTPAPTSTLGVPKTTPTPIPPKPTATAKPADPTAKPPDPTAKPTDDGSKPTATSEK